MDGDGNQQKLEIEKINSPLFIFSKTSQYSTSYEKVSKYFRQYSIFEKIDEDILKLKKYEILREKRIEELTEDELRFIFKMLFNEVIE